MAKYRVHMSAVSSLSVDVEIEDTDDEDRDPIEDAIEKAYDEHGAGLCAQCSGWRQEWAVDLGDVWETDAVEDADGKEVWATKETWKRLPN